MIKAKKTHILYLLFIGVIILSFILILLNNYSMTLTEGLKIKIKVKPIKLPKVISPEKIVNEISKPIEKTATQIQKDVTSQANKLAEDAQKAAEEAKKVAEKEAKRIEEETKRAAEVAKKAAEEEAKRIEELAKKAAEEAKKAAEKAAEEARKLAEIANIEKILGQLFDAVVSMGKSFTNIVSEIKNIGKDVTAGTQRANKAFQEIPNIFDRKLIV